MKPKLATGTRDFGAQELSKRRYIIDKITSVFERNAYTPLETPALEQLSTLTGKYGEEGDKLMFKILNNGLNEKPEDKKPAIRESFDRLMDTGAGSELLTERAMKYDLTIPFARYVAMNANDLVFPYRRYQVQPVWRADRPQKGRYREFWQCDADVVGVKSIAYDAELIVIYDDVFESLGVPDISICINHRQVLAGIADYLGLDDQLISFTVILDKLDKIGWEKVREQLIALGAKSDRLTELESIFISEKNTDELLHDLESLGSNEALDTGLFELKEIVKIIHATKKQSHCRIQVDPSLARGLDYYTGMIVEVKSAQASGSLGGGGRYDELTAIFGLPEMPGVGISFGLDRIYNLLEDASLFPEGVEPAADLYLYMESMDAAILPYVEAWRREGAIVEMLYDRTKVDKVYKKAEQKNIKYVAILTEEDAANTVITIKNIETGEKSTLEYSAVGLDTFRS